MPSCSQGSKAQRQILSHRKAGNHGSFQPKGEFPDSRSVNSELLLLPPPLVMAVNQVDKAYFLTMFHALNQCMSHNSYNRLLAIWHSEGSKSKGQRFQCFADTLVVRLHPRLVCAPLQLTHTLNTHQPRSSLKLHEYFDGRQLWRIQIKGKPDWGGFGNASRFE